MAFWTVIIEIPYNDDLFEFISLHKSCEQLWDSSSSAN